MKFLHLIFLFEHSIRIDEIMKFLEKNSTVKISLTVAVVDREAEINKKARI